MSEELSSRERILEATLVLLDADGEGGLTIDKIAETAQTGKQSIYHHFRDREGVIVAAQAERYRRGLSGGAGAIAAAMLRCRDGEDFARLIVTSGVIAVREGAKRRQDRIFSLGSATARPALQAAIREAHRFSCAEVEEIMVFGQTRGWLNTAHSPSTLSEVWFSIITGLHTAEVYADETDVFPAGIAILEALTLLLFGRTFPEYMPAAPGETTRPASS